MNVLYNFEIFGEMEGSEESIFWQRPIEEQEPLGYIQPEELRILVVPKPFDLDVDKALQCVINFLEKSNLTFFVQSLISEADKENIFISSDYITECECISTNICSPCATKKINASAINRIITLGGDGTILYVVKMFYNKEVPPIISFSLGSFGYLCQFQSDELYSVLENCLIYNYHQYDESSKTRSTFYKTPRVDYRSRLKISIEPESTNKCIRVNSTIFKDNYKDITYESCIRALNEVSINSGKFTKFISYDIFINNIFLHYM